MHSVARVLALLALLAVVGYASTTALPGLVTPAEQPGPDDADCSYVYLTVDLGEPDASDLETAIPYANLSVDRRAAFDAYLDSGEGALDLSKERWLALYERADRVHYVVHEDRLYRSEPILQECEPWQRYGNGTIAPR